MGSAAEILVLPFFGQGHLNPGVEICKHFSSHNCRSFLIIPSHLSSSIPSDLHHHPSIEVVEIDLSPSLTTEIPDGDSSAPETPLVFKQQQQLGHGIESFLAARFQNARPAFVVMDVMMHRCKEIFKKAKIPIVSLFTTCACATAMEYAEWKAHVENIGSDEARLIPGFPESIALSYSDTKRLRRNDQGGGGGGRPPTTNQVTRWMDETEASVAVLINTCYDLEAPFLEYLMGQVGKPVFAVGPLLQDKFWNSVGSVVRDRDSRPNCKTNYTEDEVIEWLDLKPHRSVIYISFGSEVGPSMEEYKQLADALAEMSKSFIWVIQPGAGKPGQPNSISGAKASEVKGGYEPHGLEERVGNRGLVIKGWAPQVAILSHPSTGGFLSHCRWNSTVEAIGCGVPILAWPIGADQFYITKLVARYLNVGHVIPNIDDISKMVKKFDIIRGIEALMDDEEVHDRAMASRGVFKVGFPSSSAVAALCCEVSILAWANQGRLTLQCQLGGHLSECLEQG